MAASFAQKIDAVVQEFKTDIKAGLTEAEAEKRLQTYGSNRLEGEKEKSLLQMFLSQFKDFLVIILIVAAALSIGLGEVVDGSIIIAIVILNAVLGVAQENRANNALKALKEMSSPQAKVLRNGKIEKKPSDAIVPGDVVLLEAGDYVPADLRLVEVSNLKIDESALTGESVPSEKNADTVLEEGAGIGDRVNSAFMGTVVTYGRATGVVIGTGMKTEMGHIATMLTSTAEESTPLQKKLNKLGVLLGVICLAICVAIFGIGMLRGMDLLQIFMTAVSLAVAAIPEGLTVVVTVILAMGMQKMVASNAIVKRLSAVETLGSTTVICSDKTGTLTQNKMTVVKVYVDEGVCDVTGSGYAEGKILGANGAKAEGKGLSKLVEGAVLCNDSIFDKSKNTLIGDPTEGALLVLGEKIQMTSVALTQNAPRVNEIPFDSDRKLMSTFHRYAPQSVVMYTKGAPDEVLKRASMIYKNGQIHPLTEEDRKKILSANTAFAKDALRVLGVAFREDVTEAVPPDAESNLVFVGLIGMIDPPREEAAEAIRTSKKAGIKVKMITGDHKVTATAIGRALGIIGAQDEAMEGKEIEAMTDEALRKKIDGIHVFARVSPSHKVRIVTAIRENGGIAAMTGDGVNDAPSLKKADIGIAMGITGTDVSKEAADMILTDDNFASIVKAVEEGRTIYNNIRKVVGYLLSCNIGEILIVFVAMLAGLPIPLLPIHLLSVNLLTDAFPAFALGMEKKEANVMDMPPRDPQEPIVDRKMGRSVAIQSIALCVGVLGSFLYALSAYGEKAAVTACFFTLVIGELLRAFSARSESVSVFSMNPFSNAMMNKSVIFSLVFLIAAIYLPFMNTIFKTVPLALPEIGVSLLFAVFPLIGGELAKRGNR